MARGRRERRCSKASSSGSVLTGHIYAGEDLLKVTATLGPKGTITGTLAATTGEFLSTFSGRLDRAATSPARW